MRGLGLAALVMAMALAGCAAPVVQAPVPGPAPVSTQAQAEAAAKRFVSVVQTVRPVAERECRARAPRLNCNFIIAVDDRPEQPVNAFQSRDDRGRPIIAFTLSLIADVANADELAFVMSHEAAHHILDHLTRQQVNATAGAQILGGLAQATGADVSGVELATRIGASVGARRYSKDYELEADGLGAVIAQKSGYDAIRGALYFTRIPDPGDRFLGTHPPNANRMDVVRRAVQGGA
jgi:Zn-dependent protease with chaperone function